MAEAITVTERAGAGPVDAQARSPLGEVLRDISRGGLAGALAGLVVGGAGGRVVMRLAAMLQDGAVGFTTENGNRIGDITLVGTLGLMAFGLVVGLLAGTIWVIVSPWIPGRPRTRVVLTAGLALCVGTPELITGRNPDFVILHHDRVVVTSLVVLVGLLGLSIALVDSWLDRRLPPATSDRPASSVVYTLIAAFGALLVFPIVLLVFLDSDAYAAPIRAGFALLVAGLCTLTWWGMRLRDRPVPPTALVIVARAALLVAAVLGLLTELPHIARAMDLRL